MDDNLSLFQREDSPTPELINHGTDHTKDYSIYR
jgi:hypothetical protein